MPLLPDLLAAACHRNGGEVRIRLDTIDGGDPAVWDQETRTAHVDCRVPFEKALTDLLCAVVPAERAFVVVEGGSLAQLAPEPAMVEPPTLRLVEGSPVATHSSARP